MDQEKNEEKRATKENNIKRNATWKERSIKENLNLVWQNITVEPMFACYILPSVLASLAVQNLNLEKACRVNKNYGDEICTNLIEQKYVNKTDEEVEVQALVAYMGAWRLPLQTTIPAIMILFIGAWSDKTGKRKPCMLVPMIGEFITSVGLILCTYFFLEWPLEVAGVIEGLPPAITGGWATMFLGVFCYIADHTSDEDRTFRIGIVNVIISIAIPVGTALSGVLLYKLGFYGVFSICLCIYVLGFLYGLFTIKDVPKDVVEVPEEAEKSNCCKQYLHWRYVYDTFMVLFKPRKLTRRTRTICVILCYILVSGPVHGATPLMYLYTRRRYSFNEVDFSIYSTYSIVLNFFGVMIGISIFSKYFKMDDSLIAVLACISKILAYVWYSFAPTKAWFYVGPFIEIIGGTAIVAMRSIATKVVESDEVGKINSIFGVCDAVVNVIYSPIIAAFYVHTSQTFEGAFCLLAAFLLIPSVIVFYYTYRLHTQEKIIEKKEYKENEELETTCNELEITHF